MAVVRAFAHRNSSGALEWLNAQALNAAEANRTITVTLPDDATELKVEFTYTRTGGAGTALTATPTASIDGTNYVAMSSRSIAAGASTVSPLVETLAGSAAATGTLEYDVAGYNKIKIVFACTSANANDQLTVRLNLKCQR